ncbi:MAG: hypothetical protein GQE15_36235 [Archangiaceae bacterium]|nr:hypothetical protein [Archangiaceae bacterium]
MRQRLVLVALISSCSAFVDGRDGGTAGGGVAGGATAGGAAAGAGVAGGTSAGGMGGGFAGGISAGGTAGGVAGGASAGGVAGGTAAGGGLVGGGFAGGSIAGGGGFIGGGFAGGSITGGGGGPNQFVVVIRQTDGGLFEGELSGDFTVGQTSISAGVQHLELSSADASVQLDYSAFVPLQQPFAQGEVLAFFGASYVPFFGPPAHAFFLSRSTQGLIAFGSRQQRTPTFADGGVSFALGSLRSETPMDTATGCGWRTYSANVTIPPWPVLTFPGSNGMAGPFDVAVGENTRSVDYGRCDMFGRSEVLGLRAR